MTSTLRLGRFAGVEIGIHWSWALIVGLITWSLADVVFPESNPGLADETYLAMAIVAVLLFFTSLLLHELGHATRATREGMEIEGITLWILGGVARFRGRFPSAGAEFRIAIAGPIVSLLIGVVALSLALLTPLPEAIDGVVYWLGYVNLVLLAFNMLPALPLDGGRVLRSALWARGHDFLAATRKAATIGRGFGQGLIAFGLLTVLFGGAVGGVWLAFIGWFLLMAADAERAGAETHEALSGLHVEDVMAVRPITVNPDDSLEVFMRECFIPNRHVAYPVVDGGQPVGLISFRSVLAVPRAEWKDERIGEAMAPLEDLPALSPDMPLETAIQSLSESGFNRTLVLTDHRLAGLLSITDATRLIEAAAAGPVFPSDSSP